MTRDEARQILFSHSFVISDKPSKAKLVRAQRVYFGEKIYAEVKRLQKERRLLVV